MQTLRKTPLDNCNTNAYSFCHTPTNLAHLPLKQLSAGTHSLPCSFLVPSRAVSAQQVSELRSCTTEQWVPPSLGALQISGTQSHPHRVPLPDPSLAMLRTLPCPHSKLGSLFHGLCGNIWDPETSNVARNTHPILQDPPTSLIRAINMTTAHGGRAEAPERSTTTSEPSNCQVTLPGTPHTHTHTLAD